MSCSPAIADSTPPKRRIRLTPRRAHASTIAAVVIGLVITGCAGPTNDSVAQGEPASTEAESAAAAEEAADAAPAESPSPIPWTPTEAPAPSVAPWPAPATWTDVYPELTGMNVTFARFAIGPDGELKDVSVSVEGHPTALLDEWVASLPDIPMAKRVSMSELGDETSIWITSGSDVAGPLNDGLPESWWTALPLLSHDMDYGWAGIQYTVVSKNGEFAPPTFNFGLGKRTPIAAYRIQIDAAEGWTYTNDTELTFTVENENFIVTARTESDGTDDLMIQPKSWDVPALSEIFPWPELLP